MTKRWHWVVDEFGEGGSFECLAQGDGVGEGIKIEGEEREVPPLRAGKRRRHSGRDDRVGVGMTELGSG